MKKFPLLLLLSALAFAPLRVSAMEREEDPKKEESKKQETEYSKQQEEKALIENVGPSYGGGTTKALWKSEGTISSEESTSIKEPASEYLDKETAPFEMEEDLSNLDILEQRIQEAQKVITDLGGKGPAIEEVALLSLYQKWSNRYERYKEK